MNPLRAYILPYIAVMFHSSIDCILQILFYIIQFSKYGTTEILDGYLFFFLNAGQNLIETKLCKPEAYKKNFILDKILIHYLWAHSHL